MGDDKYSMIRIHTNDFQFYTIFFRSSIISLNLIEYIYANVIYFSACINWMYYSTHHGTVTHTHIHCDRVKVRAAQVAAGAKSGGSYWKYARNFGIACDICCRAFSLKHSNRGNGRWWWWCWCLGIVTISSMKATKDIAQCEFYLMCGIILYRWKLS